MTVQFGADRAGRATPRASKLSRPFGDHHGYEAWRPALVAFYEKDDAPTKALRLRQGAEFDYLDIRTIKALQAAVIHAVVAA